MICKEVAEGQWRTMLNGCVDRILGDSSGWGRGYVTIDKDHPWHDLTDEEISNFVMSLGFPLPIRSVNRGSDGTVKLGFTTITSGSEWNEEAVRKATDVLFELAAMSINIDLEVLVTKA